MDITVAILEVLKYTIPSVVVLVACYLIVKKFLVSEIQRKQLAIFKDSQDTTLRLKLQAYERLILFIERISPRQLIPRVYDTSMTVRDLQQVMMMSINGEFEHNMSQQIYVSNNVWETVKNVKEQELAMVNKIAQSLDPDAHARELHARILDVIMQAVDDLPTDMALKIINDEVKKVLSYGSI